MGNPDCVCERNPLADLFARADVDDITLNPDAHEGEAVEVVVTERVTGDSHTVAASSLDEAVAEALTSIDNSLNYRQLRAYGLSDGDITDLVGAQGLPDFTHDEVWQRGYRAGVAETTFLYEESLSNERARYGDDILTTQVSEPDTRPIIVSEPISELSDEEAAWAPTPPVIEQEPAMALAGEPITTSGYLTLLRPDGSSPDAEFLALVFPVKPARA